jgi:RNA polymerase sigma-70 factor (ECF subfamily)
MKRAQAGDASTYAVLLKECAKWLRRYYHRRLPPQHIDDVVQDTLLSLHSKLATYDPARPFLPWLAAIARYRWVDHLSRAYRAQDLKFAEQVDDGSIEDDVMARISLDRLLAELPAAQSRAIMLVKIDGRSVTEAAKISGQSESLVKVNIHRGLKKLTALIEKAQ